MAHGRLGGLVPEIVSHRSTRHGLQARARDKLVRGAGHYHLHLGAARAQAPDEVRCLVGCDATADAENDFASCHV